MKTVIIVVAIVCCRSTAAHSEDLDGPDPEQEVLSSKAYEYNQEYFSIRFGGGLLFDYNGYQQDAESKQQVDLNNEIGIRDLRFLVGGRTPFTGLTYTLGYAYIASS